MLKAMFLVLALVGCDTVAHYRNALYPSYSQAEYDRDKYQCQRENQHEVVVAIGSIAQANNVVDDDMAAACMKALGWRQVAE